MTDSDDAEVRSHRSHMLTVEDAIEESMRKYDSCGALDLSSSCSGSALEDDLQPVSMKRRKRKACDSAEKDALKEGLAPPKKKDTTDGETSSASSLFANAAATKANELKVRNVRRNIKSVMSVAELNTTTKEAQAAEQLRLNRLEQLRISKEKGKGKNK